jgi:hypothetical protein
VKKMKVTVDITETLSRGISVEAASREEALDAVERAYKNSEYVLDETDFCGVTFSIEEDTHTPVTLDKGIDPRCLVLIKSGNEAITSEGRQLQAAQASYIDGYTAATGELSRFIGKLYNTDAKTAEIVNNVLQQLRESQNASYHTMCGRLNDKKTWDAE